MTAGSKDNPWTLRTAPGTSSYTMYRDETADPPVLVCQVGSTTLKYQARAVEDLHAWLLEQEGWVDLGAADEQKPAAPDTVEAWGRAPDNPVGGWYGLRKGYRGRFGMYLPPLLEELGLAELTHDARNNRMRAIVQSYGENDLIPSPSPRATSARAALTWQDSRACLRRQELGTERVTVPDQVTLPVSV